MRGKRAERFSKWNKQAVYRGIESTGRRRWEEGGALKEIEGENKGQKNLRKPHIITQGGRGRYVLDVHAVKGTNKGNKKITGGEKRKHGRKKKKGKYQKGKKMLVTKRGVDAWSPKTGGKENL